MPISGTLERSLEAAIPLTEYQQSLREAQVAQQAIYERAAREYEYSRARQMATSILRDEGGSPLVSRDFCAPDPTIKPQLNQPKTQSSKELTELQDQINHLTDLVESLFKRLESVGILKDEV